MTTISLAWRATPDPLELQWRGGADVISRIEQVGLELLTDFIVPAPDITVETDLTDGAGIEIIGVDIRVNIEELPSG